MTTAVHERTEVHEGITGIEFDGPSQRRVDGPVERPVVAAGNDHRRADLGVVVADRGQHRDLQIDPEPSGVGPVEVVTVQLLHRVAGADEDRLGLAHPVVAAVLEQDAVGQREQGRVEQDLVHERCALRGEALDALGVRPVEHVVELRIEAGVAGLDVGGELGVDGGRCGRRDQAFEDEPAVAAEHVGDLVGIGVGGEAFEAVVGHGNGEGVVHQQSFCRSARGEAAGQRIGPALARSSSPTKYQGALSGGRTNERNACGSAHSVMIETGPEAARHLPDADRRAGEGISNLRRFAPGGPHERPQQ